MPSRLPRQVCPNPECIVRGKTNAGHIRFHGHFRLKQGKRRRYICHACGSTFCSTTGTPYHRRRSGRSSFDEVCHMSVEGVSIAVIGRLKNKSWDTIHSWLEAARKACARFNAKNLHGYEIKEPQADELKTFVGAKKRDTWVISLIESSTRLWPSIVVGRRSVKNIRLLFRQACQNAWSDGRILITTDGFHPYEWVLTRMFGAACFYGQVIKTWKKNRVTKVEQEVVIGEPWQIKAALERSEDSDKLNTAFIERLHLTVRRGCSYLQRKTNGQARSRECLKGQLSMQQCHYNFMRRHMSLKFGKELWTPSMVAGIAKNRLTFRRVFEAQPRLRFLVVIRIWRLYDCSEVRMAA